MSRKNLLNTEASAPDSLLADGLATIEEARTFLAVSRAKLYLMMGPGDLAYVKMGKSRRIPWQALRQYAASCLRNV